MTFPTILFEGIDGSGKSTALEALRQHYANLGFQVKLVDSIPYEEFMSSCNSKWYDLTNDSSKYFQYLSYQVNNYYKNIKDATENSIVLIDRFIPSCYAYNVLPDDRYSDFFYDIMSRICLDFFKPNVTFLFDVENEVLFKRLNQTSQPDWVKNLEKINNIRSNYQYFKGTFGWNTVEVNGNLPLVETVGIMDKEIQKFLKEKQVSA